jgi:hypothetical protein
MRKQRRGLKFKYYNLGEVGCDAYNPSPWETEASQRPACVLPQEPVSKTKMGQDKARQGKQAFKGEEMSGKYKRKRGRINCIQK